MTVQKKSGAHVAKTVHDKTIIEIQGSTADTSVAQEADQMPPAGFPIVGIGASAGGLKAFESFFSGMPEDTDTGMAFVLVQHLAPNHKSILPGLIQNYTRMHVFEVEDEMRVAPNCTYIIPPGKDIAFSNGTLHLLKPSAPRGRRLPIDFFFASLAQDQRERAIAIILSGTGSDGTRGIQEIKEKGGMVMAQVPDSTEFNGMPLSAIATGLVDYTLQAADMPRRLMSYVAQASGKCHTPIAPPLPLDKVMLQQIFILLRSQTGHDFSQYKPNTIQRRIERRLAVHQIETVGKYMRFLQQNPAEIDALFRDLLIGVSSFFRDQAAFKALEEQVVPRLFADKPEGGLIRVWSPGCAIGEEAYSIAILLQEHMEKQEQSYKIQVFATDIDSQAIAQARSGLYPASIAADIAPERLTRFFTAEPDGFYRIHKNIRDLLIFSEQNVIKDPPFSKLDLISCRNLLIYMNPELQKKLIPLFHYAMNPGGFLFLGTSESVADSADLFSIVDRKLKLYQRKENTDGMQFSLPGRFFPAVSAVNTGPTGSSGTTVIAGKLSLRELTEQALLQQIAPTGALVNGRGDILYLHGRTGMYLEPTAGETGINNILQMAREGFRRELAMTLGRAVKAKEIVRCLGLKIKTNGDFTTVNLTIRPVGPRPEPGEKASPARPPEVPLYLVVIEETAPFGPQQTHGSDSLNAEGMCCGSEFPTGFKGEAHIKALKQELSAKEENLQSANEELKSTNEELQSTNEELETSKEELQSINEELGTVNAELQTKVIELSRANNDMNNLLAGTGIATLFVDKSLRILSYTPTTSRLINLIPSDIGRPLGHIVSNLVDYASLIEDTQAVLNTLLQKEIEVRTGEDRQYTMRILPYRTLDNVIEGAVITFVDVTEVKKAQEALRKSNELLRLAVVVRDAHDAITVQDLDGRILAWNPGAVRMYGWTESEALTMNVRELIPERLREEALAKVHQLSQAEILQPYRTQRVTRNGNVIKISMTSTALMNENEQMYAISTTERKRESKFGRVIGEA